MDKNRVEHQDVVHGRNNSVLENVGQESVAVKTSSWETCLKPTEINSRYPFVGKPLLWMTCAFGSLGDALFGYDQGKI